VTTKYRHNKPFFDGKAIIPAGTVFAFAGKAGRFWEKVTVDEEEETDTPKKRGRPAK
jgi:hypothetical protein